MLILIGELKDRNNLIGSTCIYNEYLSVSTTINNIDDGSDYEKYYKFTPDQRHDENYYTLPNKITNMVQKVVIRDHAYIFTPKYYKKVMIIIKYIYVQ